MPASRRAATSPMPDVAPVMTTTLPCMSTPGVADGTIANSEVFEAACHFQSKFSAACHTAVGVLSLHHSGGGVRALDRLTVAFACVLFGLGSVPAVGQKGLMITITNDTSDA